jgi:hypothetical protein
MRLSNYTLRFNQGVELSGLGHNWDLHNFATFLGFEYDPVTRTAILAWKADSAKNPWGDPSNCWKGCKLRFDGISQWHVEESSDSVDADTLSEISTVPQHADAQHEASKYTMWIRFENGTIIKIAAESSTLVPDNEMSGRGHS